MKYLLRNKLIIILLVIFISLFSVVISTPQQSRLENIVTAIAVDKYGEDYKVSLQYVLPNETNDNKSLDITSSFGKSVGEAMKKIHLNYGKTSGFAHCRAIILSTDALKENITEILDGFLRIKTNTNNIALVASSGKAEDILKSSQNLASDFYTVLSSNTIINNRRHYQNFESVGSYYDSFFSPVKCLLLTDISVQNKDNNGNLGSEKDSQSEGKEILNNGQSVIIKNGKFLYKLSPTQNKNLNWFISKIHSKQLEIKNFSDKLYKDANLLFDIHDKKIKFRPYFKNGNPFLKVDVSFYIREVQISGDKLSEKNYNEKENIFSPLLVNEIKKTVVSEMKTAETDFKQNKYDVIGCYDNFYKFKNKDFRNYLEKMSNNKYFMEDINFEYDVKIKQYL